MRMVAGSDRARSGFVVIRCGNNSNGYVYQGSRSTPPSFYAKRVCFHRAQPPAARKSSRIPVNIMANP
jgi:hypothetical protein